MNALLWSHYTGREILDWENDETSFLMPEKIEEISVPELPGHFWIKTSGTTGQAKWVALSKLAFLASARSVNKHLKIERSDRWLHALPLYHVGGLSILARAYLSGSVIFPGVAQNKWNASYYLEQLIKNKATHSALVPTQLYDLLELNQKAPSDLRAIVIGGARLSPDLYLKAQELDWPVLASYGMTETCSQVATAESRWTMDLSPLPEVQFRTDELGLLWIKAPSLLTGFWSEATGWTDPKIEGWLRTQDLGELENGILSLYGREDEVVKVMGEKVSLLGLAQKIKAFFELGQDVVCLGVFDERKGHKLVAFVEGQNKEIKIDQFNQQVSGPERLDQIIYVPRFPRSVLGKILKAELFSSFK